ncbi:MAG: threonine--tRNA ligase [Candidatus Nanopelagicales bacterium]|nr:threonine--tRNA ligase [Candidatus Nanopelagicales bacterium]
MPAQVTVIVAGEQHQRDVDGTTTWADVLGAHVPNLRGVVVARVDGQLVDLDQPVVAGATVEPVMVGDEDGLRVLRHSTAHVMAQAVQDVFPDAKLGIGPPIEHGFYYEFDVAEPFTPEDLQRIERRMGEILKQGQRFVRRVVTEADARAELAGEPYKCRLLGSQGGAEVMEVGGTTRVIAPNAFKVMRSSAAYWLGNQANEQLQRIYGTAWPDKDGLKGYLSFLEEAAKRDHRRLGIDLDLFSFPDEIGSGLPVFHPRGGIMRRTMEDYSRRQHEVAGYEFVYTPHITKAHLFETSGHLEWYAEGMYPPMRIDEERDAQGQVRRAGADYYLKPMNCPFHNLIYRSRGRSYRELPLRLFEFGSVYRYEKSGVVHGLTRVRGMTQDDAHIYCTRDQMRDELASLLQFVLDLLKDYGLDDFYLELSTKNPDKSVGDDALWEEATATLAEVAEASGLSLVPDPGGAAFYGPKISVQARDAIGRTWQMSTIQLDFNLPERFALEYQAADGTRQRPVMIHRALFGSVERFMGVLTEHYAGAFPPWLAPVQVVGIPVTERHVDYLHEVAAQLRAAGVRVEVDGSDDRMQKKIRNAQRLKVPYMLIAGDDDLAAGAVSFRFRSGEQRNGVPLAEAIAEITAAIAEHRQV